MTDEQTIRLRCIEAAARNPTPHAQGYAAGILEAAQLWEKWIAGEEKQPEDGISELI